MGDKSKIEWTEATWNPVVGCSIVSPGCTNCYAMKTAHGLVRRFGSAKYAGLTREVNGNAIWTGDVRLDESALDQPLRWRRPRRIFVNSMSDLFHEALPDGAIDRVFAVMALSPQHTFQVLTKRADRMREYFTTSGDGRRGRWGNVTVGDLREIADQLFGKPELADRIDDLRWPLPNVWLGVSVEDQARADERVPHLLATPAAVRFLSCEPLLGPLDLTRALHELDGIDWCIVGGESGPGARPMEIRWLHDVVSQCQAAYVPVFVKQLGARPVVMGQRYTRAVPGGPDAPLRDRKGGDPSEWPEYLRLQSFPT